MKLPKEDILFIDRYLLNSGIEFIDIRLEMVDHVVSTIESIMENGDKREFYYIFKEYMVNHKADLLHNNKQFLKRATKNIGFKIWKQFSSLKGLLLFSIIFFVLLISKSLLNEYYFHKFLINSPITILFFAAISYFIVSRKKHGNRNSALEKLGFYFSLFANTTYFVASPWTGNFHFIKDQIHLSITIVALFIFTTLILLITMFAVEKQRRKDFLYQ